MMLEPGPGEEPAPVTEIFEVENLEVEREKILLDRERLRIELRRIELEERRERASVVAQRFEFLKTAVAGLAVLGSFLAVFATYSQHVEVMQHQNELKVAEILLSDKGPYDTFRRLEITKRIGLFKNTDLEIETPSTDDGLTRVSDQWELMQLLLKYPDNRQEILSLWKVFWDAEWLRDVEVFYGSDDISGGSCDPSPTSEFTPALRASENR